MSIFRLTGDGNQMRLKVLGLLVTLYFAYGSNMDLFQMSNRCPASATTSTAELFHHRFIINARGVATVVPDPASTVYGMLWQLTPEDEHSLDRYEGVERGVYRKAFVEVVTHDGKKTKALIYLAKNTKPGKPKPGYMERILSGAEECGLPQAYIDQLTPWLK
jgi:gamma-glutamylcyclotransferase (GGCT)/AIG2-like uncharacterized protein YtfP